MDKVEERHIVAVVEDEATVTVTFAKSEFDMDESEEADEVIEEFEELAEENDDEGEEVFAEGERPLDPSGKEPWEEGYSLARKGPTERVFRSAVFERQTIMEDQRRATLAFSSEMSVDRGWGVEILDHSPGSIDMEFIGSGRAPLLVDHEMADQVGVVEQISLGSDRVARGSS